MKPSGFTQAFRSITIIPMRGKDAEDVTRQLYFFPLVGLLIGLPGVALIGLLLWKLKVSSLICGMLWAIWMAFVTRGFHLDGLGDMADGFGGGWTKERRLEIMKDSRMGSFGVIAICLCLLVKFTCASVICSEGFEGMWFMLLWTPVVSRTMVVLMCSVSEYAKNEGLSHDLVNNAKAKHSIVAFLIAVALGAVYCIYDIQLLALLIASIAASAVSLIVLKMVCEKRIGGVTGDILGATCEICECICMFTIAILI